MSTTASVKKRRPEGRAASPPRGGKRPPRDRGGRSRPRSQRERAAARAATLHRSRTPKRRSVPVMFLVGVIFLLVFAYIANSAMKLGDGTSIPTVAVQMGSMDVPVLLSGIIIRDEAVYNAPVAGVIDYYYNDLDRVSKDAVVCTIQDKQSTDELEKRMEDLEKDFLAIQERRMEIGAFKKDVDAIYLQVKTAVDNKSLMSMQADFSAVTNIKSAIDQNLKLRNQILFNEDRGSLSPIASEKQLYENELIKNTSSVRAAESGVLSYVVDGHEGLTRERLSNITPEETRMEIDYDKLVRSREVQSDDEVFKIILSNEWYIASYIPMEHVFDWMVGDSRTVYIQQGGEFSAVEASVERIDKGEKDYYVVLKSTKGILDHIHSRSVKFKITDSEHKGYKIPASAIVDQTALKVPKRYVIVDQNLYYIVRHTDLADEKISVAVQGEDEQNYYISQEIGKIVLNDSLKLPEEPFTLLALTDVVNIKGVYLTNRGYAEFRKITIDPQMPITGDYVILAPERNSGIKVHDRISSDASSVTEQQKMIE